MKRISLDGHWDLYLLPEGEQKITGPDSLLKSGLQPVPAAVPGNVELDLMQAGLLADVFTGSHIFDLRPYETYEWWYARSFTLPQDPPDAGLRWKIVFEGLDTLAEVWVNGVSAGRAENMLIPHAFEVAPLLRWGQANQVAVRLGSAMNRARSYPYDAHVMSWEHRSEGLYLRKAPHSWGWDILPRAVSAGIWRPVYLEPQAPNGFDWLYYWTRAASPSRGAELGVRFHFRTDRRSLDGFHVLFQGACGVSRFNYDWPVEFLADGCVISLPEARLWWPRGYGEPNLYELTASLYQGDELLAQDTRQVGLRKIEVDFTDTAGEMLEREAEGVSPSRWDREADAAHHFVIRVNATPVMVKGTNWVPLDAFHSRDASRLDRAIAMAEDLECNMIRCWGGGVYESEAFFDACDRKGFLVWQDFAFACCSYPQDAEFLSRVREEVEAVALRLRSHASLAVWCGDNENDMLHLSEGIDPGANRLTREVIPHALQRLDPHRAYIPSSPYHSPRAVELNLPTAEQHLWGPRGYYKNAFYTRHSAHFIGEIGYHGCPKPDSLRRFLSPDRVWPWKDNPEWQVHAVYHWRRPTIERDRIQLMSNQVRELFGRVPDNLDEFALASQITQAEAKKFFVESTRLRKWQTSGILWWNLLDGWPQFSDAVVDYYFAKKLAYFYIWRSQRPVCVLVGEPSGGKYLPLVVCNDTRQDALVSYRVWNADSGETAAAGELLVPANQNWQAARLRAFASDQVCYLIRWEVNGEVLGNHYLCGTPPFDLARYRAWLRRIAELPKEFTPFIK